MAIDYPPPAEPQQGDAQQIQQAAAALGIYTYKDIQIHLLGDRAASDAAIKRALDGADSLSDAVRAIGQLYHDAGYPAAHLVYALVGQDLYVLATLGSVGRIDVTPGLQPFFRGLVGDKPLTDTELEPRRILASIYADRAEISAVPQFDPDLQPGASGDVMSMHDAGTKPQQTEVKVDFGNPGNRYVGRYFADVDARAGTYQGDEIHTTTRFGLHGINSGDSNGTYFEQDANWNRVTPWGVGGVNGRYISYDANANAVQPTGINGQLYLLETYWLSPVYADINSHLSVMGKLDRTDKSAKLDVAADTQIQEEIYNSAELTALYARVFNFILPVDLDAGVAARKGFSGGHPLDGVDQHYFLLRPSARLLFHFGDRYTLSAEGLAQFSHDTVPEQQQWVLGGVGNVTAYLPGVAIGDRGYLLRSQAGAGDYDFGGVSVSPKLFVEYGKSGFASAASANPAFTGQHPKFGDVGGEIGLKLTNWLSGAVDGAWAFTHSEVSGYQLDKSDARVFFRLQASF
jgi:hemolysin activation/secretion protein